MRGIIEISKNLLSREKKNIDLINKSKSWVSQKSDKNTLKRGEESKNAAQEKRETNH